MNDNSQFEALGIIMNVVDAVSEDDRKYFEEHPSEDVRYRSAVFGEFPTEVFTNINRLPPGTTVEVEVRQLAKGIRTRLYWYALPQGLGFIPKQDQ